MVRLRRLDYGGVPQHIIQRGNNREVCFFETTQTLHHESNESK